MKAQDKADGSLTTPNPESRAMGVQAAPPDTRGPRAPDTTGKRGRASQRVWGGDRGRLGSPFPCCVLVCAPATSTSLVLVIRSSGEAK